METITKTFLDSIDTDQPIVTFVFTAKYATIYHELYQKQFNRELIKDGYILRPTNKGNPKNLRSSKSSIDELSSGMARKGGVFINSLELKIFEKPLS